MLSMTKLRTIAAAVALDAPTSASAKPVNDRI
jgi:hypothetical protein